MVKDLPTIDLGETTGHRLVSSKFPPIALFDDVSSFEEFEHLYAIQALTNPRLRNNIGDITLLAPHEIPFGIEGCHYAIAPFTHVNPDGSRFSNGEFGVLYVADTQQTAITEVSYHQEHYWQNVQDLHDENFVFRSLKCRFIARNALDATVLEITHKIYDQDSYKMSRALGAEIKESSLSDTVKYRSVRRPGAICWSLFSPRHVIEILQTEHLEFIWQSRITGIRKISHV